MKRDPADIICLQEVEDSCLKEFFEPRLAKSGYHCLFQRKSMEENTECCAIFYKTQLFNLLDHKGVNFHRPELSRKLYRDTVGIVAILEPRLRTQADSTYLVIANTHLLFNPRRYDVRELQMRLFLHEIANLEDGYNRNTPNIRESPVILCGDLNSEPDEPIHNVICNDANVPCTNDVSNDEDPDTIRDRELLMRLENRYKFESAHPVCDAQGQPYATSFVTSLVDYIYYTKPLSLISCEGPITQNEFKKMIPLPNKSNGSDHLPVSAKFEL